MTNLTLDKIVTLISLAIAIATSISAYLNRRDAAITKDYAASRDFGHIKNSLLNIGNAQSMMSDEIDRRFDAVAAQQVEMKAMLYAVLGRNVRKDEP